MKSLSGKIVVITGASSGIGKALALAFAKEKCRLSLAARNKAQLEETAIECRKLGADVIAVQTDVSVEADCGNLIAATIDAYGSIDILINNAGISMRAAFADIDLDVIRKIMDVNFWGTVYCTRYALPYLLQAKGSVVGISSIAGFVGLPGRTGYSSSKFAMHGFLEALRTENLKKDLHVMLVAPGFTASNIRNTALTHDGSVQAESPRNEDKMMQPEQVADELIKALKKRENTLVLTAQGKMTVLMNKLFPNWLRKQVYKHMSQEPGSPF